MQLEKRFKIIPPQLLTSNGTTRGKISIADTSLFKVKQIIFLLNVSGSATQYEIKRIDTHFDMYVGPIGGSIDTRADVSMYTVASGGMVYAEEQAKTKVPEQEIERYTYIEEPVCARRVHLVDKYGDDIGEEENPIAVTGDISVSPSGAANPAILNVPAPLANIEYVVTIPKEAVRFLFRLRNASKCQISYVLGETSTKFITMNHGVTYMESELKLPAAVSLYFQSSKPAEVAELLYWT